MNHFKDSSLNLQYTSCSVILLWCCPDDHEKRLSENYNLVEYQTKFADKICQFEKQDPFLRNGYFPCEISFRFESCVW